MRSKALQIKIYDGAEGNQTPAPIFTVLNKDLNLKATLRISAYVTERAGSTQVWQSGGGQTPCSTSPLPPTDFCVSTVGKSHVGRSSSLGHL